MASIVSVGDCLSTFEIRRTLLVADIGEVSLDNELRRQEIGDRLRGVPRGEFASEEASDAGSDCVTPPKNPASSARMPNKSPSPFSCILRSSSSDRRPSCSSISAMSRFNLLRVSKCSMTRAQQTYFRLLYRAFAAPTPKVMIKQPPNTILRRIS